MKSLYKKYMMQMLYSPLPYLCCIVFVLFCSANFFWGQKFFSETGTTELHAFFYGIPYVCILVIPALASVCGTSKKEYSLPFHALSLCGAKILCIFTVLFVCLLLTVPLPICVSKAGSLEWPSVFSAYSMALFYLLSSSSLAVFVFTAFENAGAAFSSCALILALLNSIHDLPSLSPAVAFLAPLVRFLSFAWHFDAAGKGIIDSRDISFFVISALLFFGLCAFTMEKRRGNRSLGFVKMRFFFFLTAFLLALDSSLFYFRTDVTTQKKFSLSEYSRTLLSEVDQPLSITYYRNKELLSLLPQVRDVGEYLLSFAAESPFVSYRMVDPVKEKKEKMLESAGVYPQNVRTSTDATTSLSSVYSAIILEYLGKTEVIPFASSMQTLEYQLCNKLNSIVRGKNLTAQVLCANEFDLDKNYAYIMPLLQAQGISVLPTFLPSKAQAGTDAEGAAVPIPFTALVKIPLVVLGTSSFTLDDSNDLLDFVRDGGKLFVATSPYSVDMTNWEVKDSGRDWGISALQELGVYFKSTLTADSSCFNICFDASKDAGSPSQKSEYIRYSYWPLLPEQEVARDGMTLTWPCAIETEPSVSAEEGFSVKPLLLTNKTAWQSKKVMGAFLTNPFSASTAAEKGEEKGEFSMAVELYRNGSESPSVIVFGDQYCFSANILPYISSEQMLDTRSLDFIASSVIRLNGEEELLFLKNKNSVDTSLYKIGAESFDSYKKQTLGFTCILPLLLLATLWLYVFIKRRKFNSGR
ncbi:MAG: GldG family protein [Treponema sp.]|nr:GldG family protein [Treponema sp.]